MTATSTYDNIVDLILLVSILVVICSLVFLIVLGVTTVYFEVRSRLRRRARKGYVIHVVHKDDR